MAKKLYDLAVVVGSYEKDGQTKPKYKNIGIVMQSDKGNMFAMIDPLVNLAAIDPGVDQNGKRREMILVSMFEPKEKEKSW